MAILDAADGSAVYRTLAAELFEVFELDLVHVYRIAPEGSSAKATSLSRQPSGEVRSEREYEISLDEPGHVRQVVRTGRPHAAGDLLVPIVYEGVVRTVVGLVTAGPRQYAPDEVELALTLANQASAGLAVLEMRERLERRAGRQAALARAAGALNARLDLLAVLETLCREADHALDADFAGVYLGNADGGVGVAAHGVPEGSDWWGSAIAPGEGVGGRVLASGEPVVTNDYQREIGDPGTDLTRRVETAVGVPVSWNGELKGALSVGFATMRPVTAGDIETLQAIADLAAVACGNAEAFEEAQTAARTDSLTGFLNHGAIQVRIREEIWRARRSNGRLTCLLADLDNFKPINDRHGHLVGDEILEAIAVAIANEFRPYDGIARYGGDEFVLVLPDTGEAEAREAAERLRQVVETAGAAFGDLGAPVTCSVGMAQWDEPLTAGELLDRADRALLLAKRRGKDAMVLASTETERELTELDSDAQPSELTERFWDMVSRCERPRHLIYTLPAFMRRELGMEEVAVFEAGAGGHGRSLVRLAAARMPGDPAPAAFSQAALTVGEGLARRLGGGPISRGSFAELRAVLELPGHGPPGAAPVEGSYAAIGLLKNDQLQGLLLLRHWAPSFPVATLRLADVLAGQALTVMLGQSGRGSRNAVAALAAAIDARDHYTLAHAQEVVELACEVAERLDLAPADVEMVRDGAMLHDVGKVAIPNDILYKPGPLDESDWEVMRRHPVIGERIVRRTPELEPIAPLVRHEHERWDGSGYPDGLAGDDIPIGSRIIFACDAYNAMITARPYREPLSPAAALGELERGAGTQFDPRVVAAIARALAQRQPAASAL